MAAMTALAIAGTAIAVGSTVYGAVAAEDAADAARAEREGFSRAETAARKEALKYYDDIKIPSIQDRLYELERIESQGELTPEQETAIQQEKSQLNGILIDPEFIQAQKDAMSKLDEIAKAGGIAPDEKAKLEQIRSTINAQEKANREAILQKSAQQGTLTGGGVLAAQLASSQAAAQQGSKEGTDLAGLAYQRALDAIMKRGELGGSMEKQQFSEEAEKAKAQDIINSFNTGQKANVQQRNVAARNVAQEANLTERQRQADTNVGLTNEERRLLPAATEARYADELNMANQKAAIKTGAANSAANQAAAVPRVDGGANVLAGGLAKVGSGMASYGLGELGKTGGTNTPSYDYTGTEEFDPITGKWKKTR